MAIMNERGITISKQRLPNGTPIERVEYAVKPPEYPYDQLTHALEVAEEIAYSLPVMSTVEYPRRDGSTRRITIMVARDYTVGG